MLCLRILDPVIVLGIHTDLDVFFPLSTFVAQEAHALHMHRDNAIDVIGSTENIVVQNCLTEIVVMATLSFPTSPRSLFNDILIIITDIFSAPGNRQCYHSAKMRDYIFELMRISVNYILISISISACGDK